MRHALIGLLMMAAGAVAMPASAQLSVHFSGPGVHIGVNLPVYPTLERIPGYPVYYAPSAPTNYFFYDGLYWVFDGDNWYASSWYNGPWYLVDPYSVPVFILRVPVRYYHHAPAYFHSWNAGYAPRWGEHWGSSWQTRRTGWDQWNRSSVPAAAPLPTYQRSYSGANYPTQVQQQAAIQTQSYSYQPRDTVARTYYQQRAQVSRSAPAATNVQPQQREQRAQQAQQQRQERTQQAQVQPQQRATQNQEQQKAQREQQVQQVQQQRQERAAQAPQPQREQRQQAQQQQREQRQQAQQQQREQRVQQAQQQQQQRQQQAQAQPQQRQEAQPQQHQQVQQQRQERVQQAQAPRAQQQQQPQPRGRNKGEEDHGQHEGG
jgi:hypothetical protein